MIFGLLIKHVQLLDFVF